MMSYFSNRVAIFPPLPVQPRWKKWLQEVPEIKIMYWFIHVSQTYVCDIHWASDRMEAAGCATDVVHCLTADISDRFISVHRKRSALRQMKITMFSPLTSERVMPKTKYC